MVRAASIARGALAAALLTLSHAAAGDAPVTLDSDGGDAWTFEKIIRGHVVPGACDAVVVASPLAAVAVTPQDRNVVARVPLQAGDNDVRAECRKDGVTRGPLIRQHWVERLPDVPRALVRVIVTADGVALDAGGSSMAPGRPAPIVAYEWRDRGGNPAPLAGLPAQQMHVDLPAPQRDGEYYVTLRVRDALGRDDESTAMFRVRDGRAETIDLAREHSAWIDAAVIYGVVPPLFGARGFADVTARLDALKSLAVTALWLAPVTATPAGDFGYAVTDHFSLRHDFGSEQDLRDLIAAAHARGMRVLLDLVPNHFSEQHAYFSDARRERRSPYHHYFAGGAAGHASWYFDWQNLKNLNYDDPEVQNLMIAASLHWLRTFDIDGYRVDAAWGPRQRAPEFWPRWRAELKRIKPDVLLLAEASARDPYYRRNGFDSAYDWTDKLGEWAWQSAFDDPAHTGRRLRAALLATQAADPGGMVLRFLDNNDTGARFITRYGVERARVAAAMLLTLPGIPALYTGEEVGAAFEPYRSQGPIAWDDQAHLRGWYARLLALRRDEAVLHTGTLRPLDVTPAEQSLAYLRVGASPRDNILVLLNYGGSPIEIALPADRDEHVPTGPLRDLLTGDQVFVAPDHPTIALAGHGVRVLKSLGPEPPNGDERLQRHLR